MKIYGSISRLVAVLFRKDSNDITLRPNQATTYTAARDFQFPPGDTDQVVVSATSTQTLTNKTISGASNTISNVSLTTGVTGTLPVANGGTNSSSALSNNRVIKSAGGAIVEAAAITANRALASDANGIPVHTAVTDTELGYVSGVTSAIQTQFTGKVSTSGDTMTGNLIMDNQKEIRLREGTGGGTNYVGHRGNATLSTDTTYTWVEAPGISGFVLASDTSGNLSWVSNSATAAFQANWITADGTSKVVTHSFATKDVVVQVYDKANDESINVDTIIRTDTNNVTLTASEAPNASGWRVLVIKAS